MTARSSARKLQHQPIPFIIPIQVLTQYNPGTSAHGYSISCRGLTTTRPSLLIRCKLSLQAVSVPTFHLALSRTSPSLPSHDEPAAAALRRRQDPKLAEKFNLASLNGGKSPFVVSSNRLLKVNKKPQTSPQQRVTDRFSLEYLLGAKPQSGKKPQQKNPFNVTSSKLM
jgi:hypothetical protein